LNQNFLGPFVAFLAAILTTYRMAYRKFERSKIDVFSASRHISSPTAPTLRINRAGVDGLVEELDTNFINRAVE
jgi:hypothetical protein